MPEKMTFHAKKRMQQRAIPPFVIDLLETCGSERRVGGASKLFFDKAARKRLMHHVGGQRGLRVVEQWLSVYAIVADDGQIVTTAHTVKRNRHH